MPTTLFKVTIHMVSSLDGYIAKKDKSVSWFETTDNYENGVTIILPIFLGGGTPFFDQIGKEQALHLKNVTAYKSGIVELCYEIIK